MCRRPTAMPATASAAPATMTGAETTPSTRWAIGLVLRSLLHVGGSYPYQGALLDRHHLAGRGLHRRPALDQRGETPPTRARHRIREHPLAVGLDHLRGERVRRRLHRSVVAPLHLDTGERHRLALAPDDAAEDVSGPQSEWSDQRLDLDRQADHGVPAVFGAERVHHRLRVLDDHLLFGRLPVRS